MSAHDLDAEADACERRADAHARTACALAGRAAFRRRLGDHAAARELEARLSDEERREAQALAEAQAWRSLAARRQTTGVLLAIAARV